MNAKNELSRKISFHMENIMQCSCDYLNICIESDKPRQLGTYFVSIINCPVNLNLN
jgi:hypothetical protein